LLRLATVRAAAVGDRFKAGDVPEVDHVEAQTEVKRREGGLAKAQRDLEKAAIKLSLYIGKPVEMTPSLPPVPRHVT
ncbi:hypothetical protein ABTE07_21285, partial [Acinetobacter baumannii]